MNQPVFLQRETNTPGVIGFCLMLLGYLTCGVLAIPAVFICGYAMFKEPRGLAIAGFVLSLPAIFGMVLFFALVSYGVIFNELVRPQAKPPSVADQIEKIQAER